MHPAADLSAASPSRLPDRQDGGQPGEGPRWALLRIPAGVKRRIRLASYGPRPGERENQPKEYALPLRWKPAELRPRAMFAGPGDAPADRTRRKLAAWISGLFRKPTSEQALVGNRAARLAGILFALALLVYAGSRLIRIADYPIYFFTDEANQANLAADLLRDGFRDSDGHFLPTYFKNVYEYNLSLSVYLQVLPVWLFGRSIAVTRGISALVTLLGAAAVGLSLDLLTTRRRAWIGVLLFGLAPAWFLHSRTAFETALMVSCYALFLYAYLLYRLRSARFLPLVILAAALTFYSYAPAQIVIVVSAAVFLVADWRYHWQARRTVLYNLPVAVLAAVPYVRFQTLHPGKHAEALRILGSFWVQDIPFGEKLAISLRNYLTGLSPAYWLTPNQTDLVRHQMDAFGHLLLAFFPLLLLGLLLAARRWREPGTRSVLLALLVIPTAGIPAGVGITRVLSLTVPAALLTGFGLGWLIDRLPATWSRGRTFPLALFVLLAGLQLGLLADALQRGPYYSRDYGMHGMQWGAAQVFGRIETLLEADPDQQIMLSPTWANGVDVLLRFFLPDDPRVQIANAAGYLENLEPLDPDLLFVLTGFEVDELLSSPKIGSVDVVDQIDYPDGSLAFSFLHLSYSPKAAEIFAEEVAERQRPRSATLEIDGIPTQVEYPYLDMGAIGLAFDGDPYTLARVYEANPARFVLTFDQPRAIEGVRVTTGSMDFELSLQLLGADGVELAALDQSYHDMPDDPTVQLAEAQPVAGVKTIVLEIHSLTPGDPFKIHIREIEPF